MDWYKGCFKILRIFISSGKAPSLILYKFWSPILTTSGDVLPSVVQCPAVITKFSLIKDPPHFQSIFSLSSVQPIADYVNSIFKFHKHYNIFKMLPYVEILKALLLHLL